MITKYVHRDPEYVPKLGTNNRHHETWAHIKAYIDKHGFISHNTLMGLSRTYGMGSNRGTENYGKYLIKPDSAKLIEVKA